MIIAVQQVIGRPRLIPFGLVARLALVFGLRFDRPSLPKILEAFLFRLTAVSIVVATLLLTPALVSAAMAQVARKGVSNAQKREKCEQLARDRGFLGGGRTKGAIKPRHFIQACMQGKVPS